MSVKLHGSIKRNPGFQIDDGLTQLLTNKNADINVSKTAPGEINKRLFETRYYYLGPTDYCHTVQLFK